MKKFTIIGSNSSLAQNFIYYLRNKDIVLKLYDIQENDVNGSSDYRCVDFFSDGDLTKIDYDCDALFLFSGLTGAESSLLHASRFVDINEKLFLRIVEAVKNSNSKCRIVYPSSRLVYKDTDKILSEDSELEAKSVYALNKIFCENCLKIYNEVYGVNYTVFRIAIPFGKLCPDASSFGIVAKLQEQSACGEIVLFGEGDSVRTFTHIENICEVFYFGGIADGTLNGIYNIGGSSYSFYRIATELAKKDNSKITYKSWPDILKSVEVKNGHLSSDKLDTILPVKYLDIVDYIRKSK